MVYFLIVKFVIILDVKNTVKKLKWLNLKWLKPTRRRKKEYGKRYYEANKDKISLQRKQYRKANLDKISLREKQYRESNRERINKRERLRYLTNFNYKVKQCMRSRIRKLLKTKSLSTLSYVGCKSYKFKLFLGYQFTDGYNYENYGTFWQIDHVIPCSFFDFSKEENIKKCFNWTNCQPLVNRDNNSKNDQIDQNLINSHKKIVESFEKLWDSKQKLNKQFKSLLRNQLEGSETR
jgi:hypothetical protein